MSNAKAFILPISGLGKGFYEYDLLVDEAFFAPFPTVAPGHCHVELHLTVNKQSRDMTLDFDFSGTIGTDCDRCLAAIQLPIADRQRLVLKFKAEVDQAEYEGDIVYLHPDTAELNLAPFVYEMVLLALPMIRTYACREGAPPYPCDEEMLNRIEASYDTAAEAPRLPGDGKEDDDKGSPWDVLKDLK